MSSLLRITTEQPYTLTVTLTPQNSETPTDPDGSTVTIGIVHVNGTVIVPAGTATTRAGAGAYTYALATQPLSNLIVTWSYTVSTFPCTVVQYLAVIQSHYIELSEIRALDGIANQTAAYPTATLVAQRDYAETLFDWATGTFWTPHYVRDTLDGDPNYRRALQSAVADVIDYIPMKRIVLTQPDPTQLLSLTLIASGDPGDSTSGTTGAQDAVYPFGASGTSTSVVGLVLTDTTATRYANIDLGSPISAGGFVATIVGNTATTWSVDQWIDAITGLPGQPANVVSYSIPSPLAQRYVLYPSGEVEAQFGVPAFPRGMDNVIIEYVAGRQGMPLDLKLALTKYVRYLILNTNGRIPDRATSMTTEFGTFRVGQADAWDHPTGLSEVDAVLERYGLRSPVFA